GTRVTPEIPLYERDPEAWQAYLAEGNRTQPRKRVSADVLFRDESGQILLVDRRYKPDWDLPGAWRRPPRHPWTRPGVKSVRNSASSTPVAGCWSSTGWARTGHGTKAWHSAWMAASWPGGIGRGG